MPVTPFAKGASTMPDGLTNDIRRAGAGYLAHMIGQGQFELGNEKATQEGIWELLFIKQTQFPGLAVRREHRLAPGDIVDLFIPAIGTAIEVKLKRNRGAAILRQLERYAAHDAVQALILVTNRAMGLPQSLNGKPVYYVSLGRAWL